MRLFVIGDWEGRITIRSVHLKANEKRVVVETYLTEIHKYPQVRLDVCYGDNWQCY